MIKLTRRKGFNFFRSYYDVYNELNDKEKVEFMDALLDRQFLGVKPTELTGMAKFAYISQTNSIDSQVKGYEDKTKTKLSTPCLGGEVGGVNTPSQQEEEEEEEKGKGQYVYTKKDFLKDWNTLRTKHLNKPSFSNRLTFEDSKNLDSIKKDYTSEQIREALIGLFKQKNLPNGLTVMQSNPKHFLEKFESYFTAYHDKNDSLYGKKEIA